MKKLLLTLLTSLTLASCITQEVLYMHEPFNNSPVLEDDSVKIAFEYSSWEPMKIFAYIVNKTDDPINVIWKETLIDSLEIQFKFGDTYLDYLPEEIKPHQKIMKRPLAIRKFYTGYTVPMFDYILVDSWGLATRDVVLTIDFGNRKKSYHTVLGVTKTKRRLKEPPQYKKEYYE